MDTHSLLSTSCIGKITQVHFLLAVHYFVMFWLSSHFSVCFQERGTKVKMQKMALVIAVERVHVSVITNALLY